MNLHLQQHAQINYPTALFNLSKIINSTDLQNGTYKHYHPDIWNYNGYPHDTFAVQFTRRNTWLVLYVQILMISMVVLAIFMAAFLFYIYFIEGTSVAELQSRQE